MKPEAIDSACVHIIAFSEAGAPFGREKDYLRPGVCHICKLALTDSSYSNFWLDRQPVPSQEISSSTSGAGTELTLLLKELGIQERPGCSCKAKATEMDGNGIAWVKDNRDTIVNWLREGQANFGWLDKIQALVKLVAQNPPWLKALDPLGSMVDEAIKRAEVNSGRPNT